MSERYNEQQYQERKKYNLENEVDYPNINANSWYTANNEENPLVAVSVCRSGPSRENLAGNMGKGYGDPNRNKEDWPKDADRNVNNFLKSLNISPSDIITMYPQDVSDQDLIAIDVDAVSMDIDHVSCLDDRGDFIFTRNPEIVLGVKPADCSSIICFGETDQGPILSLTHISKNGAIAGYVDQMFHHLEILGVKKKSLKIYFVGGAYKENRPYTSKDNPRNTPNYENLLKDISQDSDGLYHYNIDLPGFIRWRFKKNKISDNNIFEDTSDTARPDSGYSSHSRAVMSGGSEPESRDLVVASMRTSCILSEKNTDDLVRKVLKNAHDLVERVLKNT